MRFRTFGIWLPALLMPLFCKAQDNHVIHEIETIEDQFVDELNPLEYFIVQDKGKKLWHEDLIPENWICGYALYPWVEDYPIHGIFLVKSDEGYLLLLNSKDPDPYGHPKQVIFSDTIRIDEGLAGELEKSLNATLKEARKGPAKIFEYDGNYVMALKHGVCAEKFAQTIPDALWEKQIPRFNRTFKPFSVWAGGEFFKNGKKTYRNLKNQAELVRSNDTDELTIPSQVKVFKRDESSIPVTSIAEYAFKDCNPSSVTLESVKPIPCPANAFDDSVYENAVLNVPKRWKQRKAARIGTAWGRFKNVEFY